MALHVTFTKDTLKADGSLRPRVHRAGRVKIDELVRFMAIGTAIEEADIVAVLSRLSAALTFYLSQGDKVTTPIGTFSLGVRGGRSKSGEYAVNRDRIALRFLPDRALAHDVRRSVPIVVDEDPGPAAPSIVRVTNADGGAAAGTARPGDIVQLGGWNLRFAAIDPEQGVFLVSAAGADTRVRVISRAGPRRIDFQVPDLAPGRYRLEVRARHGRGDLRVGSSDRALRIRRDR